MNTSWSKKETSDRWSICCRCTFFFLDSPHKKEEESMLGTEVCFLRLGEWIVEKLYPRHKTDKKAIRTPESQQSTRPRWLKHPAEERRTVNLIEKIYDRLLRTGYYKRAGGRIDAITTFNRRRKEGPRGQMHWAVDTGTGKAHWKR